MRLQLFPLRSLLSFSSPAPSCSFPLFISYFSTSQAHPFSRRHEEESRNVKVSVWWDFENCTVSAYVNVFKIANTITAALRANGIMGPLRITAFGDISQLSRATQEALSSTGVNLYHVPNDGKNSADRLLLVDLLSWVSQNPPPAHLFLISSDRDYATVLHKLRMNNYNILLASRESAPNVLCSAASIMWNWGALLKGEELRGKYYNKPPDGPYGSWYGHYNVSLEDPFLVEQPVRPRPRPVPKAVTNRIRLILNSYPKGISIMDLRTLLTCSKIELDKDFYGYKKFLPFLLSMPHILRLRSTHDGQFVIRGVTPKTGELSESSPALSAGTLCRDGDELNVYSSSSDDGGSTGGAVNDKSRLQHCPEINAGVAPIKVQHSPPGNDDFVKVNAEEPPGAVEQTLPVGQKIAEGYKSNDQVAESHQGPMLERDSESEVSFFRKVWQRWLGDSNCNSEVKNHDTTEKHDNSEGSSVKQNNNNLKKCTGISSEKEGMKEECKEKSCEAADNKGKTSGLFIRIASRCKFWRSSQESCEKHGKIKTNSLKHEVFTQGSFLKDMENLMDSAKGSLLITQSRTREEMVENLQKRGPLALKSLSNTDLLQLVNLLISDKKWIEECPSRTNPFKINRSVYKSPDLGHSNAANGLGSIFMSNPSEANLQPKHEGEKELQNVSHSGVSSTFVNEKSSDRSRYDVLGDCEKLVKEILKEHPEGYNISNFRNVFLSRYGYSLNIQGLGYQKLSSLLEIMPGVKIESTFIIPASTAPGNSGLQTAIPNIRENSSHAVGKTSCSLHDAPITGDDDSNKSSTRKEVQPKMTYPDYEPSLRGDEISDSKGEISTSERSQPQPKLGVDSRDSPLLEILSSWYNSKEERDTKYTS
ncbi:Mitochondrial Nuclease2 [Hibiscus trionum]|uniref:Mitochondrial Nuclease2 n=1 Tax=Hibiscus trionum TaxID=183268 RepID=A0A9W7H2G7_HIBTR|nr:Mitochondrial Nuclease2 [Hibiscus trionum]